MIKQDFAQKLKDKIDKIDGDGKGKPRKVITRCDTCMHSLLPSASMLLMWPASGSQGGNMQSRTCSAAVPRHPGVEPCVALRPCTWCARGRAR